MKNKQMVFVAALFLVFCPLLPSCKEDPPAVSPADPTETFLVTGEFSPEISIEMPEGSPLFLYLPSCGYLIGYTSQEGKEPHLAYYASDGSLCWDKGVGPAGYAVSSLDSITGGEYLLSMYHQGKKNVLLYRTDHDGDTIWRFSHAQSNSVSDACILSNGQICLATVEEKCACLMMLDGNGDSLSSYTISDTMPRFAAAFRVVQTSDNGIITAYNFNDASTGHYVYLTKSDICGNPIWQHLMPDCHFSSSDLLPDGRQLSVSADGQTRILITNWVGEVVFSAVSVLSSSEGCALMMHDGRLLLGTQALLSVFDASGSECWSSMIYPDPSQANIICRQIIESSPGSYLLFGYRIGTQDVRPVVLCFQIVP